MSAKPKTEAESFFDDLDKDKNFPDLSMIDDKDDKKVDDKDDKKVDDKDDKKVDDKKVDDLKPVFDRKERKKETRDESISNLRKQFDELKETSKAFTDIFGDHKPHLIKPLLDFITEEANGPLTEDYINGKLLEFKESKEREARLKGEVEEREKRLTELDIRTSREFKEGFELPYQEAMNTLFLEFATVAPDKTIVAPKATAAFNEFLTTTKEIDGITVKQKLIEFRNAFKQESGEDPTLPSVTALMGSLRLFNSKRKDLQEAYSNWKFRKKEEQEKALSRKKLEEENQRKAGKRARVDLASRAFQEFDLDETPFIKDDEIKELFTDEFQFAEGIYEGEKVPEWNEIISRGVKSRLWDKYLPKLRKLIELEEAVRKGERNNISGKGFRVEHSSGKTETDWLGEPASKK